MKKIKFRGKSVESGQWLYGSLIDRYDKKKAYIVSSGTSFIPQEVNPDTVGQFTEIVDSQDIEIYEDDIVSFDYRRNGEVRREIAKVTHSVGGAPFVKVQFQDGADFDLDFLDIWELPNPIVLGNIYDNRELIE